MCREVTDNAMSAIQALKATIEYLKNNRSLIVDTLVYEILTKNEIYTYELKKDNNLINFKNSLIYGHFQWMIDYSMNPDEINFDEKYRKQVDSLYQTYCDFYKFFAQFIKETNQHEKVKNILNKYNKYLSKEYCY